MTRYRLTAPKPLSRSHGDDVRPGDTFEPSDAEITAFGDILEPVEEVTEDDSEATRDTVTESEGQIAVEDDAPSETDSEGGTDSSPSDDTQSPADGDAADHPSTARIDEMGYRELQTLASDVPHVKGNQTKEELRDQLVQHYAELAQQGDSV